MKIEKLFKEIKYVSDLTQSQIAEILEIKQASVSRIKTGKQIPRLSTAKKIVALAKKYKIKVKLEDLAPRDF